MLDKKAWNRLHFFHRIFWKQKVQLLKKQCHSCGNDVSIPPSTRIYGNLLSLGNHVYLGENCVFMCTRSPITIGDYVMVGPGVTMISGDHRIDIKGEYMIDVKDSDKLAENDLPIVLMGDNWIGANVTILKGVTIGEGAVVAAGSLVNKDVPDYAICAGVPAKMIRYRFEGEALEEHKRLLMRK